MRLLARWGTPFGEKNERWLSPNEPDEWGRRENNKGNPPGCLVLLAFIILITIGLIF